MTTESSSFPPEQSAGGDFATKGNDSPSAVWASLSSISDKTERLAALLERVGPEEYNKFIHSSEYLES